VEPIVFGFTGPTAVSATCSLDMTVHDWYRKAADTGTMQFVRAFSDTVLM